MRVPAVQAALGCDPSAAIAGRGQGEYFRVGGSARTDAVGSESFPFRVIANQTFGVCAEQHSTAG